jgi:hypothetical protein
LASLARGPGRKEWIVRVENPETRIRYLSLALFAQRIVDGLINFLTENNSEAMVSCAKEALLSLGAASGQESTGGKGVRAFTYYEQVRTLEETSKSSTDKRKIIKLLQELQNEVGTKRRQRNNARKAIEFFYRLEKQALLNYGRPGEPLPRGIRELCQVP